MEKFMFLDVEGVIATNEAVNKYELKLNPLCQKRLGHIIQATGAGIVLCSSWRLHTLIDTIEYMKNHGFEYCDYLIGITIRAYHYIDKKSKIHLSIPRGVEIKQWIDTHVHSNNGKDWDKKQLGVDYNYVILDDDTGMLLEHKDYFVNTDKYKGLSDEDAERAIRILNYVANKPSASQSV
jgi:hypothetical protein